MWLICDITVTYVHARVFFSLFLFLRLSLFLSHFLLVLEKGVNWPFPMWPYVQVLELNFQTSYFWELPTFYISKLPDWWRLILIKLFLTELRGTDNQIINFMKSYKKSLVIGNDLKLLVQDQCTILVIHLIRAMAVWCEIGRDSYFFPVIVRSSSSASAVLWHYSPLEGGWTH